MAAGEDEDEEDAGGSAASGKGGMTKDSTRKWLKGFKAEDILRDKTLLRQQLEVGWSVGWLGLFWVWEFFFLLSLRMSLLLLLLLLLLVLVMLLLGAYAC